ncbi:hypothetical protein KAR91_14730 [Candidatus Pacearchaeota archaeon]|nr:hypothetical protein [Candidatus Pacearchaeota archaeon]
MSYKPVVIKKDPVKTRLKELKRKPILTPQEIKETLDKLIELAGIK